MLAIFLVLSGGQIAGVCVKRFQKTVQCAAGYSWHIGLFHVFTANPREHFAENAKLAIGTVIGGGVHSQAANHGEQNHCG